MSREKDEGKRQAILEAGKRLFGERGFHGASVADLARETGLPVGSIYTYFEGKDAVIRAIVEEGWSAFYGELSAGFAAAPGPAERLSILVDRALPSLFADLDFIAILLAEAGRGGSGPLARVLEEKLEALAGLVAGAVAELAAQGGSPLELPPRQAMTGVCLFFLGSLDTLRLARGGSVALSEADLRAFIRFVIENTFGISLPPLPPPPPAAPPA
jgi:AcrR family transcriptional regulator